MSNRADWLDLWAEYGFGEKDSAGGAGVYTPQLKLAVDIAEERLDVEEGISEGYLRQETAVDGYGIQVRKRIRLAGVSQ